MNKLTALTYETLSWIVAFIIAIFIGFIIREYCAELYVVDGTSMYPTLNNNDKLLIDKITYRFIGKPERGDVIVFHYPSDPSRDFIKRVIALPGDTIEIANGSVLINDKCIQEDYILDIPKTGFKKATVPPNSLFVMGDNRNNSEDSRFSDVGFVAYNLIVGRALCVFWPEINAKKLILSKNTSIKNVEGASHGKAD